MNTEFFDGHNDVLSKLIAATNGDMVDALARFQGGDAAQAIDMPKARAGNLIGGFFAIYMPSQDVSLADMIRQMSQPQYCVELPRPLEHKQAYHIAMQQAQLLMALEEAGLVRICRSVGEIEVCKNAGPLAAIMHMEGVEAFSQDLSELDAFYALGLRSLGPVWSRPNIFGHGVPFAFPSSPDTGPGLSIAGKNLIARCDELGVLVDLSHLNEAGFWDVAAISSQPLVATHSNVHAICPSSRNLTDQQLEAIAKSGGVVGVNFAVSFLREDGQKQVDTKLEIIAHHVQHMIDVMGEDHVALGSDYDGAVVPVALSDASKLQELAKCFRESGLSEVQVNKICSQNWLRVLGQIIGH